MDSKRGNTAAQRGIARSEIAQSDVLRSEGAEDVTAALEEVGLVAKTGWYASILLYGAGGLATIALYLSVPAAVPVGVFYLAMFAILLSVGSVFGALYLSNANWATHMRLILGLSIFLVGAFVAGPSRVAFVLLPLFVLITPSYLYGVRFAIPYTVQVTAITFVVLATTRGPARIAHATVTVGAELMIVVSFMVAQHATRRLARLNRELAYSDPLTGIANMRRLRERLATALGKPFGEGKPLALFAIDLDNFKVVNDTFDHTTGDRVLRAVADELSAECDVTDLVARRGGDEFSVLVEQPEGRDLDVFARRLAAAIGRARTRVCPQVTPSGSVAYVRAVEGDTTADLLRRADDALHNAKTAFHAHESAQGRESGRVRDISSTAARVGPAPDARRKASLERVTAAVSRAYEPRRSYLGRRLQNRYESLRGWWSSLNPMWSFSAVALTPAGFAMIVLTLAGQLHPLPDAVGLICGAGYYVLAGFGLWAGGHDWPERIMHMGFVVATLLTLWASLAAGASGTALIDILPVLVLYAFYFVGPREALPYLVVLMALYSVLAVTGHYAYGGMRAGIGDTVVAVLAALVTKVRGVTVRFARTNAELSEIDPLTGVANVRALGFRVADAVDRARREGVVPTIVTVDLDSFKLVNDNYSHSVGDQTIESVARAMVEAVRAEELVARRGGDEFFVLFEDATEDHVGAVIDRLYETIRHARERLCPDLPSSSSIGAVTLRSGESAEEFLRRADLAMHDEKLRSRAQDDLRTA